jgi:3-methyladenine DNA glycosylase AlkD
VSEPFLGSSAAELAAEFDAEVRALPERNTPSVRAVRRRYSRRLKRAEAEFVLEMARTLVHDYDYRGMAYELIENHKEAFQRIDEDELLDLGHGIDSWWSVDSFARVLSGPAWLHRQIADGVIHGWVRSEDRWWRRAALVSTVALNVRSKGGHGDVERTLAVCRMLVDDRDDMVVKAMSWALRELVVHDPEAVRAFLAEQGDALAARARREVQNKLDTGLKSPRKDRA